MANVNTSYKNADTHGRAAFEQLDTYTQGNLLAGSEPALEPAFPFPLAASTTLAQFSVVGLNSSGKLVLAVSGGGSPIQAIGVLAHAASLGSSGSVMGHVWLTGCFNIDADSPLVWDASFDTLAEKEAAFRGAPTPTRIVTRGRTTPAS